jgi:hypothetical protein
VAGSSTTPQALLDPAVAAPAVPWLVSTASAVIIGMPARRGSLTASP